VGKVRLFTREYSEENLQLIKEMWSYRQQGLNLREAYLKATGQTEAYLQTLIVI